MKGAESMAAATFSWPDTPSRGNRRQHITPDTYSLVGGLGGRLLLLAGWHDDLNADGGFSPQSAILTPANAASS